MTMTLLTFQRNYTKALRLWHWCSFLVVTILLMTVFTGKFFLNDYTNGFIVKDQLSKRGVTVTMDQAFQVSSVIGAKIWQVHIFFGYILTGLFVFRMLMEFFQSKEHRIGYRLVNAAKWLFKTKMKTQSVHHFFVQVMYLIFYLLTAVLISTGLWLTFNTASEFSERIHQVKELHQQCFFGLLVFIFVHLAGVIRTERIAHSNLVSAMIHGGEKQAGKGQTKQRQKEARIAPH